MINYYEEIITLRQKINDLKTIRDFRNHLFTEEYKKNFPNIDEEIERCENQMNQLKFDEYASKIQKGKYYKYDRGGNLFFIFIKNLTNNTIVEESIECSTTFTNQIIISPKKKTTYTTDTSDNLYLLGDTSKYIEITKEEYDMACSIVKNIEEEQKILQKIMS